MAGSNTGNQVTRNSLLVEKPKGGRPSKFTPDVIVKLKAAFANSFTVEQACYYAGVNKQTYYNWLEKDQRFLDEMEAVREAPTMKAKQVVVGAINSGDVETSKWWLKHKASDEFGGGQAAVGVNVNFINVSKGDQGEYGL